jgi:hypothetical protein
MKMLMVAAVAALMTTPVMAQTAFEFRSDTTAAVVDIAARTGCERESDGKDYCSQTVNVGGVPGVFYTVIFYNGRMTGLGGMFAADSFMTLRRAFTEKYGSPAMSTEPWQNRAGASFTNTVATWVFSDGTLVLKSLGRSVTHGSFRFYSTVNQPPATAPTVNF